MSPGPLPQAGAQLTPQSASPTASRSGWSMWAHGLRFAPAMPRHGPRPPTLRGAPTGARSPALAVDVVVIAVFSAGRLVPSVVVVAMGGDVVGLGVAAG